MNGVIAGVGCAVLVLLAAIDVRRRIVPNAIVVPAAAAVLAAQCAASPGRAPEWLAASLGTFAFLLVVHAAYPPGLGMGDVKLGLLLGAALGARTPEALLIGTFAVGVVGLGLLAVRGVAARKTTLPFAPFLAAGALAAVLASADPALAAPRPSASHAAAAQQTVLQGGAHAAGARMTLTTARSGR